MNPLSIYAMPAIIFLVAWPTYFADRPKRAIGG